ncbi:MAG: hypothetical protein E6J04_01010 [Chloroflexi bacterium]|nr:MAG: hypothetical protein E6J36_01650 [Chloroflexota bacterium]TMD38867.1 MAG: hypothetical protein E6J04_01010 [Chloroflexota bacterium]
MSPSLSCGAILEANERESEPRVTSIIGKIPPAYFPNLHPGPTSCSVTGIFFSSKDLRASYLQHSLLIPQAWSGFSRHQSVKFHPSVQISTFQCKIGPPFSEFTNYLQTYADHFALPIQTDTRVMDMQKRAETFVLQTTQGTYQAATVIVATGPFHHPRIPAFASALSPQVEQLHSAAYRNPSQIPPGPVLVVGAGDSGAHTAAELAHAHPVSLAAAHPLYFVPLTLLGKSLFWYLDRLHLLEVDGTRSLGAWLKA